MAPVQPSATVTTTRTRDTSSSASGPITSTSPNGAALSTNDKVELTEVERLKVFLGPCDPNKPVIFMKFVDKCSEYIKNGGHHSENSFRLAVLQCMQHEAYHWYVSVKSTFEDQPKFLRALQKKFRDMVLAAATRDMALLEPASMSPVDIRTFLEDFYSLADVIEHFNKGTNVYGLLYKRLYKHDQIKKHLMGPGRESDLLTNCMDIKAITLREEYAEHSDLIQRAMSTSNKHCNHSVSPSIDGNGTQENGFRFEHDQGEPLQRQ